MYCVFYLCISGTDKSNRQIHSYKLSLGSIVQYCVVSSMSSIVLFVMIWDTVPVSILIRDTVHLFSYHLCQGGDGRKTHQSSIMECSVFMPPPPAPRGSASPGTVLPHPSLYDRVTGWGRCISSALALVPVYSYQGSEWVVPTVPPQAQAVWATPIEQFSPKSPGGAITVGASSSGTYHIFICITTSEPSR